MRELTHLLKLSYVKGRPNKESPLPGMEAFAKAFKPMHQLLVGGQGISLEEFFLTPVSRFVELD